MKEIAEKKNVWGTLIFWESNLFKRILLIFIFAFILVVAIVYLSNQSIKNLEVNTHQVLHTQEVLSQFDELLSVAKDAEIGQRGFLLTNDSAFLVPYKNALVQFYPSMHNLRELVKDNDRQLQRLVLLDTLMMKKRSLLKTNLDGSRMEAEVLREGKVVMDSIRSVVAEAKNEEVQLMEERNRKLEQSRTQTKATIAIFSFMALALVIIPLVTTLFELRKRLELQQFLDSVLNSSLSGILSFQSVRDLNGNIIDFKFIQANEISYKLVRNDSDALIGKTFLEVFPAIGSDGMLDQFISVVETGIPLEREHYYSYDEKLTWLHLTAVKLRDGFTLTLDDITKNKNDETTLENNVAALKRSNLELEQFAYVASHDLQEPLRKILAFSDRLKVKSKLSLEDDSKNYVDRIVNSAERMRVLINDLLSYSRAGSNQFEMTLIDLNQLLKETLSDFEVVVQQKHAVINVGELPVIEGVKVQLQQLFQNLISNSLKFSKPDCPPLIQITNEYVNDQSGPAIASSEITPKSFCRISVNDNGIGFDEKYGEKIFQIFQRLHGRSEYEGTGIGLAICNKIVDNHRGIILAHSVPDQGSTFIIVLPLKQTVITNEPAYQNK